MTGLKDWTVATFLDRRINLAAAWEVIKEFAVDVWDELGRIPGNFLHFLQTGQFPEDRIPDPLRVLAEVSGDSGNLYEYQEYFAEPGTYSVAFDGKIWGPYDYRELPDDRDPVRRAMDLVAEQQRILYSMLGPWELPDDPFDPNDWEGLARPRLGDSRFRVDDNYWDDVIIRGTN